MNQITHQGTITQITDSGLDIQISQTSACLHCQLSKNCGLKEVQSKIISVSSSCPEKYHIGQKINIAVDEKLGWRAIFQAYLFPLLVLILGVTCLNALFHNDSYTAIGTLLFLSLYYLLLAHNQKQLSPKQYFCICDEKMNNK